MTGPQGMGPLMPQGQPMTDILFSDDFNRADASNLGGGGNWDTATNLNIVSNRVNVVNDLHMAVWADETDDLDHWSQMSVDVESTTPGLIHYWAGPAVRMNQDPSTPGDMYYAHAHIDGFRINKRLNTVDTVLAFYPLTLTPGTDAYVLRLAAVNCTDEGLGVMLILYLMSGTTPTFVIAGHDDGPNCLMSKRVGFAAAVDNIAFPSPGHAVGDNWSAGNFFPNDGSHDVGRMYGGWTTKASTVYTNEMQVGTTLVGIRGYPGSSFSTVPWLCVAGGGPGGWVVGGGGGGGGVRYGTMAPFNGTLSCVVGQGGPYGSAGTPGTQGSPSSITGTSLTTSCTGGGRGAGANDGNVPQAGGSGGGDSAFGTAHTGGSGVSGEGFKGGDGNGGFYGASGGGAGAAGVNANGSSNVAGGDGKQWPTASGGDNQYYGGGGGSGSYSGGAGGAGGLGGGGQGGTRQSPFFATSGTPKTGGGGGGGGHNDSGATGSPVSGNGGSGVIKFRTENANWTSGSTPASPVVEDTFNRANNSTSIGTSSSGHTWVVGAGTWGINAKVLYQSANEAGDRSATGTPIAIDSGSVSRTIKLNITREQTGANVGAGILFRYPGSGTNDWFAFYVYRSVGGTLGWVLNKRVGGTTTTLASGTPASLTNQLKVVDNGTNIDLYINGRQVGTTVTDTALNTNTHQGVIIFHSNSSGANTGVGWRFNNFNVV